MTTTTLRSKGCHGVEFMTPVLKLFDDACFGHKRHAERLDVLFKGMAALAPVNISKRSDLGVRFQVAIGVLTLT